MSENRRYTVEAQDEYGDFDYDMFEDVQDAMECAAGLDVNAKAKVIDRQEQAVVWSAV